MGSNLPSPDTHMVVDYRITNNTLGKITDTGLTLNNRVGNDQKKNNTRLTTSTNKGLLAGSVVAVVGSGEIGPCAGDSSATYDKAVGVVINDALGNAYESSSAVASERVVYLHGTGSVFSTDIYETKQTDGTAAVTYTAGDKLYASQNGLLTNVSGVDNTNLTYSTFIGILLNTPSASNPYMNVQMRI